MTENRLADYLSHIQQAAEDACVFIEVFILNQATKK